MDFHGDEAPVRPLLLQGDQGVTPDEIALVEADKAVEAGFPSRIFDRHFTRDQAVALLDGHGCHGADAERLDSELGTCIHQHVENRVLLLDRVMQLPTEFAHEVDAQCMGRCRADCDFLSRKPREIGIGERRPRQLLENLAGIRTCQHHDAIHLRDRSQGHRTICRCQLHQHIVVMGFIGSGRNQIEATRLPLIDREFGADAAMLGEQMAQRNAATLLGNGIGEDRVEPCPSARA